MPGNLSLGLEGQDGIRHLCKALRVLSCHFNFEREVSQSSFTAEGLGRVFLSMMKSCSWSLHEEGCGQETVG